MYCPECGGEYREGFFQCADCDVALVETAPMQQEPAPVQDLVTVLETGDPGVLALAESLLLEAGIPYRKKGESVQDLFAMGRLGVGFDLITGPVLVQVAEEDAQVAALLLAAPAPGQPDDQDQLAGDRPTQE
jgi:hypothetical protein